nr:DUF697 domain-containing protein [uncultured Rhodopila sp.]
MSATLPSPDNDAAHPAVETIVHPDAATVRSLAADSVIKDYVLAAVATSVLPLPLVDVAAVFAIQLRMIQKLAQLNGKPFSEQAVRGTVTSLAGGVLGYGAGTVVALSIAKFVPGIGAALGIASLPVVVGATTFAIGRVYQKHFDGNTPVFFDLSEPKVAEYFREQFEIGKAFVAKAKAELKAAKAAKDTPAAAA